MEVVALLRDLVIIVLGLVWIAAGALVGIVAWLAWKLLKEARRRAEELTTPAQELYGQAREALGSAGETARTAKETVTFVGEKAVMPTIVIASAASGVKRFVETLLAGPSRNRDETA